MLLFFSLDKFQAICFVIYNYFISGRYFDEISQDTGKYCFGVEDTLKALEMGSVEILIAWENLDIVRYVLKNHATDGKYVIASFCILHLYSSYLCIYSNGSTK